MFRLDQSSLNRTDLNGLAQALSEGEQIDAGELAVEASQLAAIRALLPSGEDGVDRFKAWRFDGTKFLDGCDFNACEFRSTFFTGCQFGNHVCFRGARFQRARFDDTHFGTDVDFEHVNFGTKAEFRRAEFGARPRFAYGHFQAAQFVSARFGGEAAFARTHFEASAKFHGARFGDRANFTEAHFPRSVDFGGVDFGDKLQMVNIDFAGSPSFRGASFGARARLLGWRVVGSLDFRSSRFAGDMTLHGGKVAGDARFEHATFGGWVDLGELEIGGSGDFSGVTLLNAERLGPINAGERLLLGGLVVHSACVIELAAPAVNLSDARFLAPARVELGSGDVILDRLDTGSRLVFSARPGATTAPRLVSVQAAHVASLVIFGLDVRALRFQGAEGIDGLRIESGISFEPAHGGLRAHREVVAEEQHLRSQSGSGSDWYPKDCQSSIAAGSTVPSREELARIYRGLRKAREDARDAPGAADFYYGEMEMRRLHSYQSLKAVTGAGPRLLQAGSAALLELYRIVGGYGVRPSRPLLLFVALTLVAAVWVDSQHLVHQIVKHHRDGTLQLASSDFEEGLVFVLRSALLLPTSSNVAISTGAEWLQVVARILGPLLVGLFAFGIRARVHR